MSAFNASAVGGEVGRGGSKVGGGSSASATTAEERTLAEVAASRDKCQKEYLAGIEVAKQKYIAMWKKISKQQESASFEEQLDRAAQPTDNSCQESDHPFIQLYIMDDLSTLKDALYKEENRLDEVIKKIEAEVNAVDVDILRQVQAIVPDYERVIRVADRDDNDNDNMLRINKLVESMLLQQVKLAGVQHKSMMAEDSTSKDNAKAERENEQATRVKEALQELKASRSKCQKEYNLAIDKAKQKYIAMWKKTAKWQDSTSSEEQLNRASETGSSQESDHAFVQLFISDEFSTLNEAWQKQENRLDEDEKKLDAEVNAVDDGILLQVQAMVPGYERVILRDNCDEYDTNMLRINKLLENVLLRSVQQEKLREEMTQILEERVAAEKAEKESLAAILAAQQKKAEEERLAAEKAEKKQIRLNKLRFIKC